jgi:hypothetical protein
MLGGPSDKEGAHYVEAANDEGIDQEALLGAGGLPTLPVFGGEGLEIGGVLAADDLRFGVNAGFGGVEAGDGLALDGARAGGVLRVETIRFDLLNGGGRRGVGACKLLRGWGMGIWRRLSPDYSWEADSGRFLGWRGGAMKRVLEGPDPWPAIPGRAGAMASQRG